MSSLTLRSYPFGLVMAGISSKALAFGEPKNKEKTFQGQRFDDDLGLNWVQFKWRNHDPQIGRFIEIDPLSDDYPHNSAYAFSENRVINGVELEGLEYMTYGYNAAGAEANIQATAQRSSRSTVEKKGDAATQIDAIPGVGDAKGFVEAFTGRDLVSGEKLGLGSRLLGLFFLSELRAVDKGVDATKTAVKIDKEALERGVANEKKVLSEEGLKKNTTPVTVIDPKTGKNVTTIPDANKTGGGTVEVKDVKKLSDSKQLRAQSEASAKNGQKATVITGTNTKVSSTVENRMKVERKDYLGPQN